MRNIKSSSELKKLDSYTFIKEEKLEELNSVGLVFKHKKSGARVVVISNDDNNKVFSIGFRTPPTDSTGVPHIIEHTVLCGSKEFPSKDPFVELVKGSLNTFLNAMTYSDKTIYPVASCNDKDLKNLMHVYMDAVFYPNIYKKEEIFKQEGWHYELESEDAELKYNGVVYNEMKGVFSSPEQQLFRKIQQSLFPDTTYGFESGGDPEDIPSLTYEEFLDFHRKYYHPSNSYIYLYGDIDIEERLMWMDEHYLKDFDDQEVDSKIPLQKEFTQMKEVKDYYSVSESTEEGTYLSYNLVIDKSVNKELYLAFQIIEYVLLSSPGATLKKALIDAGIGKDILSSYDNGILQPVFSIIAKDTSTDKKEEFIKVIKESLVKTVKEGFDKKSLQAAINYFEFKYREADFGSYPKGLMYGIQILDSWLYDDEKLFIHICANETFDKMKNEINNGYFEKLVDEYLLNNKHVSLVIVEPKVGLTEEMERNTAKKLKDLKDSLNEEEIKELVNQTKKLVEFQETPSTKEELEKIPMLDIEDIDQKSQQFYNKELKINDIKVLHHEMFTNEIGYLRLIFDLKKVPKRYVPYVGLLEAVLFYVDTKNYSYLELSNEINIHTGGIGVNALTYSKKGNPNEFMATFEVCGKVIYKKINKAFELINEMITNSKLSDTKRIYEIVLETKSRLQMKIQSSGHAVAVNRVSSYISKRSAYEELIGGISYYRMLEDLANNYETKKEEMVESLEYLMKCIFKKENLMISYTSNQVGFDLMQKEIPNLENCLYKEKTKESLEEIDLIDGNEGFKNSGKVQYVATTGNFITAGNKYTGALKVLKVILSYDYLWTNIRVKGGAYGCMCGFSYDGTGYLASYRDPNLRETVEIYKAVDDYVEKFDVTKRDMLKYIIGTISSIDTPLNPSAKGRRSLTAYLSEITLEDIKRERKEILEASNEKIRELSPLVKAIVESNNLCVIGNAKKIEDNKELFDKIETLE